MTNQQNVNRPAPECETAVQKTRRWQHIVVLILGAWLSLGCVPPTWAQETCVPLAEGGTHNNLSGGRPGFFGATNAGYIQFNDWVDDPRWEGAASHTHGSGAAVEIMQFRAMHPIADANNLYFSWWVRNTSELNCGVGSSCIRRLYVGFANQAGANGEVLQFDLTGITVSSTSPMVPVTPTYYKVSSSNTTLVPQLPLPSWASSARAWLDRARPSGGPDTKWAVNLQVPRSLYGGNFRLWYSSQFQTSGGIVTLTWPRSTATQSYDVSSSWSGDTTPSLAAWPAFHLSSGPSDTTPSCLLGGIKIEPADIKVSYVKADGTTSTTETVIGHSATGIVNTFTATPTNSTGSTINSADLHARFRIANWGAQLSGAEDVSMGEWNDVPGLGDVQQTSPASVSNSGKWNIVGTRTYTDNDFSGKSAHQCIQVELFGSDSGTACSAGSPCPSAPCLFRCPDGSPCSSGTTCSGGASCPTQGFCPSSGLSFLRSSAFRNMMQAHASTFRQDAEVSLVGLPANSGVTGDVYLYVESKNMPAVVNRDKDPITPPSLAVRKESAKSPVEILAASMNPPVFEVRAAVEPTYVVRAFYDTGRKVSSGGKDYPALLPMVPFGYFVEHTGDLTGWRHELSGAEKISGDWYRVHVQNEKAKITTTLVAVEPPCLCACTDAACLLRCKKQASNDSGTVFGSLTLVGTLGVGGFAFLRRRRNQKSNGPNERNED